IRSAAGLGLAVRGDVRVQDQAGPARRTRPVGVAPDGRAGRAARRAMIVPRRTVMDFLRSSALASAFATTTIGPLFSTHLIRQLMGDAGYGAVVTGLCLLGGAMLVARRRELRTFEIMPTTLLLLLVWLLLTMFWSRSMSASLGGWMQLAAPTFLAIVV